MKKKRFSIKPYDASFAVVYGTEYEILKYHNDAWKDTPEHKESDLEQTAALTLPYSNGSFDILLIHDSYSIDILVHELMHGLMHVAKYYNLKFRYDYQEPICYLFQYMFKLANSWVELTREKQTSKN